MISFSLCFVAILEVCSANNVRLSSKFRKNIATLAASLSLLTPSASFASTGAQLDPSDQDIQLIQMAFRDFDDRRFEAAEKEFSMGIEKWRQLNRPRDEQVSLLKARGNVRLDNKNFKPAVEDFSSSINLMRPDGEKEDGTANYPEYVDAYVGRGLAHEGLADWSAAVADYDKAVSLWGGGRGENVNPYVLTYRGNALEKLGNTVAAVADYEAASNLFLTQKDIARYSDARANLALALYQDLFSQLF